MPSWKAGTPVQKWFKKRVLCQKPNLSAPCWVPNRNFGHFRRRTAGHPKGVPQPGQRTVSPDTEGPLSVEKSGLFPFRTAEWEIHSGTVSGCPRPGALERPWRLPWLAAYYSKTGTFRLCSRNSPCRSQAEAVRQVPLGRGRAWLLPMVRGNRDPARKNRKILE